MNEVTQKIIPTASSLAAGRKPEVKPIKRTHARKASQCIKKAEHQNITSKSIPDSNVQVVTNPTQPRTSHLQSKISGTLHTKVSFNNPTIEGISTGVSTCSLSPTNPDIADGFHNNSHDTVGCQSKSSESYNLQHNQNCKSFGHEIDEASLGDGEPGLRIQTSPKLESKSLACYESEDRGLCEQPSSRRSETLSTNEIRTSDNSDRVVCVEKAKSKGTETTTKAEPCSPSTTADSEVAAGDDSPEDRFSIDEDTKDVSTSVLPVLTKLASDWEHYFVRVGDWLVSATEGADSNPPSDHEEEAAGAADASKAGFASGLASFNLSGVSSRASASAKTVGSFFGTAFSKASASVKEAGTKIKETVEKNPLLTEFNKEQEAFIAAKGGKTGEALPPWVGYPNEEKLKEEILSLSTERKNFVRNPPTGVIFEFDLDQFLPVAQATLAADPNLDKMRFELVPKVVSEEVFWRNYFYRVGLIRQSTELSSLEQDSGSSNTTATENKAPTPEPATPAADGGVAEAVVASASESHEFVSESFQPSSEDVEDIKRDVSSLTKAEG